MHIAQNSRRRFQTATNWTIPISIKKVGAKDTIVGMEETGVNNGGIEKVRDTIGGIVVVVDVVDTMRQARKKMKCWPRKVVPELRVTKSRAPKGKRKWKSVVGVHIESFVASSVI